MSIFDGLDEQSLADSVTDPKRLFRALQKPVGSPYKFPHDIQSEVWDKWHSRRTEPDLIIKMNTGSGKTVIGLLILKSSLNEGIGPAVFLVPDRQLQKQAQETATRLGLQWASRVDDPAFREGGAILIATVHTMYNGRSAFGVRGAGRTPLSIGAIVIDDAHACIPIIEQQFSLRIPRDTDVYARLFSLFEDSLKKQTLSGFHGLQSGEGTVAVPVPYWDWQAQLETAFSIIHSAPETEVNPFVWRLICDQLRLCDVGFIPSEVEIRLPLPDLSMVPSFVDATRRIYMTATLADDSMLTTHMNVHAECVTAPVIPESASDLGDRIILTPIETSRKINRDEIVTSLMTWAATHNIVVIVPSRRKAEEWCTVTQEIHDSSTIESVVERLQQGHLGLVVLIARYDGVDLPNDACRILVLDGLPELTSPCERIELEATMNTSELNRRQIQRIEQGMGRGVRATDDYCAVLLMDPRLVERLYSTYAKQQLSPATRAQYELSRSFSESGRGQGVEFYERAITEFLDRAPGWTNASKTALEDVTYEVLDEVPLKATAEREAFEHALAGRFTEAKKTLSAVWRSEPRVPLRGWVKQRAAAYLNCSDEVTARQLQESARKDNSRILKLPGEPAPARLTSLGNQAAASAAYIKSQYESPREFEIGVEAILRDLTPSPESGTYSRFEDAMEKVGHLLGFSSSRPDQATGIGPDNLWGLGDDHFWILEAKSEAVASEISRDNLEQLSHSTDWFDQEYSDPRYRRTPILIHPSTKPMSNAVPRQDARVLSFEKLASFRGALRGFANALASEPFLGNEMVVKDNLEHHGLAAGQMHQRWTSQFDGR